MTQHKLGCIRVATAQADKLLGALSQLVLEAAYGEHPQASVQVLYDSYELIRLDPVDVCKIDEVANAAHAQKHTCVLDVTRAFGGCFPQRFGADFARYHAPGDDVYITHELGKSAPLNSIVEEVDAEFVSAPPYNVELWRHVSDTTRAFAHYLVCHPKVCAVRYPGLKSDPSYERAAMILEFGFGPYVSFQTKDDPDAWQTSTVTDECVDELIAQFERDHS